MTNNIGNRHQPDAVTNVNPAKLFITLTRRLHTEDAIRLDKNGSVLVPTYQNNNTHANVWYLHINKDSGKSIKMTKILHESTVRDNEFNCVSLFTQLFSQRLET